MAEVWFRRPADGRVTLAVHEDTQTRLVSDGWQRIPDPRLTPATPPMPATPTDVSGPSGPSDSSGERVNADVPATDAGDLTAIGDSPEGLAATLEQQEALARAQTAAATARNSAARAAFGFEQPQGRQSHAPAPRRAGNPGR